MTNLEFARRCAQIAKRAAGWSFDSLTMGDDYLQKPTINNSAERFCVEIDYMVAQIRANAGPARDGETAT